MNFKDTEVFRW